MKITNKTERVLLVYNEENSQAIPCNETVELSSDLSNSSKIYIKYHFGKETDKTIDSGWSKSALGTHFHFNVIWSFATVLEITAPYSHSFSIVAEDLSAPSLILPHMNLQRLKCISDSDTKISVKSYFCSQKAKKKLMAWQVVKTVICALITFVLLCFSFFMTIEFFNKTSGMEYMVWGWILTAVSILFLSPNIKLLHCAFTFPCNN